MSNGFISLVFLIVCMGLYFFGGFGDEIGEGLGVR